jgi:hypothetical protein
MKAPRRRGSVIIRWWYEQPPDGPAGAGQVLRGSALDLGGKTIGHFEGVAGLTELMGKVIHSPVVGSRTGSSTPKGGGAQG